MLAGISKSRGVIGDQCPRHFITSYNNTKYYYDSQTSFRGQGGEVSPNLIANYGRYYTTPVDPGANILPFRCRNPAYARTLPHNFLSSDLSLHSPPPFMSHDKGRNGLWWVHAGRTNVLLYTTHMLSRGTVLCYCFCFALFVICVFLFYSPISYLFSLFNSPFAYANGSPLPR